MHPAVVEIGELARERVQRGDLDFGSPPREGGARWGATIVALPDDRSAELLDRWSIAASAHVGAGWRTGALGSSHVTLRSLDRWRAAADPAVVANGARMLGELGADLRLRARLAGIAVAAGGVLAVLEPEGDEWCRVRVVLGGPELSVVHTTLVHFTTGIDDPDALLDWAASVPPGERIVLDQLALVRYDFEVETDRMMPTRLKTEDR